MSDRLASRVASDGDANRGQVRWHPGKSLLWTAMLLGWILGGIFYTSWDAVLLFFLLAGLTLCLGHSIGMHRKLIHESFHCPLWLERVFVFFGTMVGLGGPLTLMRTHDLRDWAQRQPDCHPYLTHQSPLLKDFWWQVHCELYLERPPSYRHPARLTKSPFYRGLDRHALAIHLAIGATLFLLGGWGWVAWGLCARVTVSIFGHWCIGYFAHNQGHRDWHVEGAAVQGFNLPAFALVTFGECWHNNHHAFPDSAKLAIEPGQWDPGWTVLQVLARLGLAEGFVLPKSLPNRPELRRRSPSLSKRSVRRPQCSSHR